VKVRVFIVAGLGLCLAAYLVLNTGLNSVLSAAVAIGWTGFAIVCLYAFGLFAILGAAWHALIPEPSSVPLRVLFAARMVRDAATEVLPFSHVGGVVLGARTAMLLGVSRPLTAASMIVDFTSEMLAQLAFVALGVVLLCSHAPRTAATASLISEFIIGLLVAAAGAGAILLLQRRGARIAEKVAGRLFPDVAAAGAAVAAMLQKIYGRPGHLALSVTLHFAGWTASAVGTWVAFRLMGVRVDLASVIAIESLVYAVRGAAFMVPNAIGVQEAAYAILAPLFGVGAEFGLGISLLKRARDVALGIPILLVWQGMEGRRALA
jgi:glycosyltransferase 2 family protein